MFSINDRTRRRLSLLLTIAIGVGSISAAAGIFTDPSGELLGIAASLPYLQKIPLIGGIWRSFLPAVIILLPLGAAHIAATALLLMRRENAHLWQLCCGAVFAVWALLQLILLPERGVSAFYALLGAIEALLAWAAMRAQESSSDATE